MKRLFQIVICLCMLMLGGNVMAQADKIVGTYDVASPFNSDKAHVKITKTSKGTYQGRIVWTSRTKNDDGTPVCDIQNPDPKLRNRKPEEIIMVWNLSYEDGEWVGGTLYDPYSGKKFSVKFNLDKNNKDLKARYYKGVPAAGINAVWKRLEK